MFRIAVRRSTLRALAKSSSSSPRVASRALSVTARAASDHSDPIVVGKGSSAGEVPSNATQATGHERLQLLGEMEGYDFFETEPLWIDRMGTPKDPIIVKSMGYPERLVGCSGYPVESHEIIWMNANAKQLARCPECGCAFKLEVGTPREEHHH
ncbi:COX5B-domain-containing protein [Auriculariales sp. MPI-PUGE-AT-0066]|nr:COX5B-domain-containing protein [Auriculariales sp. MPI-PUGE-AT-0066]